MELKQAFKNQRNVNQKESLYFTYHKAYNTIFAKVWENGKSQRVVAVVLSERQHKHRAQN